MIDPIDVMELDVLFERWIKRYRNEIELIPGPVILVDAKLPAYLELITEIDAILQKQALPATVHSIGSDDLGLHDENVVLCITRRNSMLGALARAKITSVVAGDMGQIWEVLDRPCG